MCLTCQAVHEAVNGASAQPPGDSGGLSAEVELLARGLRSHPFVVATRRGELSAEDARVRVREGACVMAAAAAAARHAAQLADARLARASEEFAADLASDVCRVGGDEPDEEDRRRLYETGVCATVVAGTPSTVLGPLLVRIYVVSVVRAEIGDGDDPIGDFLTGATEWAAAHEATLVVRDAARRTTSAFRRFYDALDNDRTARAVLGLSTLH